MVSRWWRGWVAPLGTALGVLVVVLGLHYVVGGGGGGSGPGPDEDANHAIDPPIPTAQAEPVDLAHHTAAITGYRVQGRRLTIDYTMRYSDCLVTVVHPQVAESGQAVVVRLQRVPIAEQKLYSCPTKPVPHVVSILLGHPLSTRGVLDGSDHDRIVPRVG